MYNCEKIDRKAQMKTEYAFKLHWHEQYFNLKKRLKKTIRLLINLRALKWLEKHYALKISNKPMVF